MKAALATAIACASLATIATRPAAAQESEGPTHASVQPSAPPPGEPDHHARRGLSFGLRFTLNIPTGATADSTTGSIPQHDTTGIGLGVGVDLAYRLTPRWYVGGYFQSAYDFSGSTCSNSCTGYDLRFGLDVEHHFAPGSGRDLWVGVGGGYEVLHAGGSNLTTTYRGLEFMMLEVGDDLRLGDSNGRLGPFVGVAGGEYQHISQTSGPPPTEASLSIPNKAVHVWIILGVRGRYDL
jgi:hypothetical protein